ncbi:MAG: DUF4097 family beta strand repeat protein [Spirochaetales bacterium]|nr:DUF4097 family beta strand repeat protein [Spirochaetales bacterium]
MRKSVLFLCILLACLLCGCRGRSLQLSNTYKDSEKYQAGSFSYRASDIDAISIDYNSGDVTIVQSDSATLNVTENGLSLSDAQKVHWYLDGRTLRIKFCKSGFTGTFLMNSKKLTVEIPAGIRVDAAVTSGNIAFATDIEASELNIAATSGSIGALTLKSNSLNAGMTSGTIRIDRIDTGEAAFGVTSGSIFIDTLIADRANLGGTSCRVEVTVAIVDEINMGATSGNLKVGLASCRKAEIECASGDIDITALPADGATVQYARTSGSLKASGYSTVDGKLVFGKGGCQLKVGTTSGDLSISEGGAFISIRLAANPTTGCTWRVEVKDPTVVRYEGSEYEPDKVAEGIVGSGGYETFIFRCLKQGETEVDFIYGHAWAKDEIYDGMTAQIRVDSKLKGTAVYPVSGLK